MRELKMFANEFVARVGKICGQGALLVFCLSIHLHREVCSLMHSLAGHGLAESR